MRYLALTTVFIMTAICSMAQNYIKFAEATEINGRKFFKGEIYQQISDKKILFGKDTIDLGKTKTEKAEESFLSKITWWQYIIGGIILLIVLYLIYKFVLPLFKKAQRQPIKKKFQGGRLSDFARNNNIDLYDLEKFNKSLLKGYSKMEDNERKKLQKRIEGEYLILGYKIDEYSNDNNIEGDFETASQNTQTIPESIQPQQNTSEISSQIQRMESRILNKIESLASNKEASQKIENLQKEIESFKGKITLLNKDIEQGNQKINELNSELTQVHKKKQEIEGEYLKYSEKVIFVDYLEPYAKATYDYYNFCQTGYIKALEYFKKLNHSDSELVSIVSQLLVKFNSNIPSKTNHWVGVINEIKDSKATANIDLIKSLKQIPNNEEKSKEFKRILLKEVFEKYTSSVFILTEEFSNLSKFSNDSTSVVKDFEQFFTSFKSELHSKSKAFGLDLNYVPLFEHYEKYAAFTKLANQTCSLPYKSIKNITKDSVLEIINYGFGNEETNVILA